VAGNLTDGMKTLLKGFPPVLVAISKGRSVDWMGQALTTDTTIAGQLKANYPSSGFDAPQMDCDRVVQIDGVWMPMPHLKIPAPTSAPETRSPSPNIGNPIMPPPSSSSSSPTRSRRGRISIPTRSTATDARLKLEQAWEVDDGEVVDNQPIDSGIEECYEIINGEPDAALRDALMIGFDWYLKDRVNGTELTKETFINRAKTNRKSDRLKEDRQSIWLEVQELISYYESL
jgi:hypothetical protein